jgi:hypothetical protein
MILLFLSLFASACKQMISVPLYKQAIKQKLESYLIKLFSLIIRYDTYTESDPNLIIPSDSLKNYCT